MHDQSSGMTPGRPVQGGPPFPPPPAPPFASGAPAPGYPPPPGYVPGQALWQHPGPGHPPPVPAPGSRMGLWIALGTVGALLVAGTATAAVVGGDDGPAGAASAGAAGAPKGSGGGAAQGAAGNGAAAPDAVGGGKANAAPKQATRLYRVVLPDRWRGMPRTEDSPMFSGLKEIELQELKVVPGLRSDMAIYAAMPNMVSAVGGYSDVAFASPADVMQRLTAPAPPIEGSTVVTPLVAEDPGPQGGQMKCQASSMTVDTVLGPSTSITTTCLWVDGNTIGEYGEEMGLDDPDMSKTAARARQFRAAVEVPM